MPSQPHSATVRGTFSNPKTASAISSNKQPSQPGDPVSLTTDTSNKSSSHQSPQSTSSSTSSSTPPPSSESKEDLPHSKKVRGTLGSTVEKKVNKTMLGDPASLTAETSKTKLDGETESGVGKGKGEKSKL